MARETKEAGVASSAPKTGVVPAMGLRRPRPIPEEKVGEGLLKEEAATGGGLDAVQATPIQSVLERGASLGVPAAPIQEAEKNAGLGEGPTVPSSIPCFVVVGQNGPFGEAIG